MKRYIIGLDAGTTSVRSVIYDILDNKIVCLKRANIRQYYPQKGYVEQDAEEIFFMLKSTMEEAINEMDKPISEYIGVGLTNQRETIVAFNADSGKPAHKALVWQDRRTNDLIESIKADFKKIIKKKTGLIPDAYFSASKMKWLIDNSKRTKDLLNNGKLRLGTLDSYLAYKFTGNFVTDTTNASRTMLYNINKMEWDDELLEYFSIPKFCLPKVVSSSENIGNIKEFNLPLLSIIGDQQASLVGNGALSQGMAKNTYGTGCFILMNTGNKIVQADKILTTVAYTINGETTYALEGSIFSACSALNWTKENLGLSEDFETIDTKIFALKGNNGIYFVPAFTGLGAPYWDATAQATLTGITFDTNKYMIMRAVYESMAYNTKAIIDEMTKISKVPLSELRVDGGGSKSKFLLSFQSDILSCKVFTGDTTEATVLGAIYMAGLTSGALTLNDIKNLTKPTKIFIPTTPANIVNKMYEGWNNAVKNILH